jgi:WD40 repeat protein
MRHRTSGSVISVLRISRLALHGGQTSSERKRSSGARMGISSSGILAQGLLSLVCASSSCTLLPLKPLNADAKVEESPRAIHAIASAQVSPYSFASGSADGSVRLWDWRERKGPVYIVAHRNASIRSLAIGPFADAQLNIVAGLDSGMLFRYDLRVSGPTQGTVPFSPD